MIRQEYRYEQIEDLKDILKCKPTLNHYFLCENAEESSKLLNQIKAEQSKFNVVGIGYPVFCTDELNNNEKMNSWIQHSKADIVWVLLNSEMQEQWLAVNQGQFDSVVIGLGEKAKQKTKSSHIDMTYVWKRLNYQ